MVLSITPGPLPEDGARIRIEGVLSAFVSGTEISNFGLADFNTGDFSFLTSSTDAPATSSRSRLTLWFARGQGVLYKWEIHPSPTDTTAVTEGSWLAISNRREMLVKVVNSAEAGDAMGVAYEADTFKMELAADGRHTLLVSATSATDRVHVVDPIVIATSDEGTYRPAVEWGFTSAKVVGNDVFGFLDKTTPSYEMSCTGGSAFTSSTTRVAITSQSDSSTASRQITMFLCPSITNQVR